MDCKNCKTELTQMKNETGAPSCLRCLKCHPMPTGAPVVKAKKDNVKVDEPWTPERIWKVIEPKARELFTDLIEDYVIAQNKTEVIEDKPKNWREQAKELGIAVYDQENSRPRLKVDVLADIAAKLNVPNEG